MDRNSYVDLSQMYLVWKLNFVKGPVYETCKTKEAKKEYKEETKAD